jgi:hypothetical protein
MISVSEAITEVTVLHRVSADEVHGPLQVSLLPLVSAKLRYGIDVEELPFPLALSVTEPNVAITFVEVLPILNAIPSLNDDADVLDMISALLTVRVFKILILIIDRLVAVGGAAR